MAIDSFGTVLIGMQANVVSKIGCDHVSIGEVRQCSGPAGVFPFGLTGKPVVLASEFGQFDAELLRVEPGDPVHWVIRALASAGVELFHDGFPLFLRDGGLRQTECAYVDQVLRFLVPMTLGVWTSHGESASW